MDDLVSDNPTFSLHRERLFETEIVQRFENVVLRARLKGLVSGDHVPEGETLLQALAPLNRFAPKDHNGADGAAYFSRRARGNRNQVSTIDPGDRPVIECSGMEANLCYLAKAMTVICNGASVGSGNFCHTVKAGLDAALGLRAAPLKLRTTLHADEGHGTQSIVVSLKGRGVDVCVSRHTKCPTQRDRFSQRTKRVFDRTAGAKTHPSGLRMFRRLYANSASLV